MVCATGNIATCVTVSGMRRIRAASDSSQRCAVVHTEPSPRDRRARRKLHAAGRIEPNAVAAAMSGAPSNRRSMHGMTSTGTCSMVVASCSALSYTCRVCGSSSSATPFCR